MPSLIEIAAGEFDIGDEFIANASPKHRRRLSRSIWIDADPVTWAHFEVFVAAGGYRRNELWIDDSGLPLPWQRDQAVDFRCRAILDQANRANRLLSAHGRLARDRPLTSINWFEARAIAHFYGARLPFEIEWEVAMRRFGVSSNPRSSAKLAADSGHCHSFLSMLQEWAADAFSSKYWRADFDRVGVPWSSSGTVETPVVVRGSSPDDLIQDISWRHGVSPTEGYEFRSFRRVWDERPPADLPEPKWRPYAQV